MSAVSCPLGTLHFLLPRANLALEAYAEAHIINEPSNQSRLFMPSSEEPTWDKLWVQRGFGFHISLTISNNGRRIEPNTSEMAVVEELRRMVLGAELWSQLQLSTTSPESIQPEVSTGDQDADFTFGLSYTGMVSLDTPGAKKIGVEPLRPADVRAPPGIPTANVGAIHFHLDFTQYEAKRKRNRQAARDAHKIEQRTVYSKITADSADEDMLEERDICLTGEPPPSHPDTVSGNDTVEDNGNGQQNETMLYSQNILPSISDGVAPSIKFIPSNLLPLQSLVDTAVRTFIIKRPIHVPRSICTKDEETIQHLTDVAPAIFDPGYASAVGYRASLIPALAKSLATILTINKSYALDSEESDLSEPVGVSPRASIDFETDIHNEVYGELKDALSQRLWRAAAYGLRGRGRARKLRKLFQQNPTVAVPIDDLELSRDDHPSSADLCGMTAGWADGEDSFEDYYEDSDKLLFGADESICHEDIQLLKVVHVEESTDNESADEHSLEGLPMTEIDDSVAVRKASHHQYRKESPTLTQVADQQNGLFTQDQSIFRVVDTIRVPEQETHPTYCVDGHNDHTNHECCSSFTSNTPDSQAHLLDQDINFVMNIDEPAYFEDLHDSLLLSNSYPRRQSVLPSATTFTIEDAEHLFITGDVPCSNDSQSNTDTKVPDEEMLEPPSSTYLLQRQTGVSADQRTCDVKGANDETTGNDFMVGPWQIRRQRPTSIEVRENAIPADERKSKTQNHLLQGREEVKSFLPSHQSMVLHQSSNLGASRGQQDGNPMGNHRTEARHPAMPHEKEDADKEMLFE